ncbi:hypothetical protein AVEN_171980-1 [Araneus ventricosus]|uniref:Uncharacterized protein n=1 Tax=Araneus ventricosus TaxID=182803 RepID=A0A4Y2Q9C4_ARAVE|nr:hypothetical protein AVEN_171980-1 [Araneus ventricosus]
MVRDSATSFVLKRDSPTSAFIGSTPYVESVGMGQLARQPVSCPSNRSVTGLVTGTGVRDGVLFCIMPSVSLRPINWVREDVIFFSQHGTFPAYLKRFHLSDSDYCSCGGIGTALHYATECIYRVSWHMRKPASNFEQEWLKRVANNLAVRHKIRGIVKFISRNRYLFRPP